MTSVQIRSFFSPYLDTFQAVHAPTHSDFHSTHKAWCQWLKIHFVFVCFFYIYFVFIFMSKLSFVWKWLWYKCLHKITPLILRNCGQIFWVEVSKQNIQKIDTNKLIKDLLPKCGIFSMFLNLNKKVFFHEQFCFRLLTLFSKISILDVWLDSEYVSEQWSQEYQKQH